MHTNLKGIAYQKNTISRENLPFPIVLYPGHYGAFFGFKKDNGSSIYLCSCSLEAIENYLKLRLSIERPLKSDPIRMFIFNSMYFPYSLVEHLMKAKRVTEDNIIQHLLFENKICHECNKATPSYRFCHEMYGGAFQQNYGWYINKQAYEWGVEPISNRVLKDSCPEEILDLIQINPEEARSQIQKLQNTDFKKASDLNKLLQKQRRRIWNVIENEVRRKFGHKKVGETWTSETILYSIIKNLFPCHTIRRHYRPEFLEGLELDIFIEELQVGIEYQGVQHYKPIKHWGGKEALEKLKKRDKLKKIICDSLKIPIVYFYYSEGLDDNLVLKKVKKASK